MSSNAFPSPQDELYNPRKAAQVIAYFALSQGGRAIDVLKAIKLTYLADRESLRRFGAPILHELRASLRLGPVNQTTLDYIDENHVDPEGWSRIVSPRAGGSTTVSLEDGIAAEDLDEFSDGELEVLADTWTKFGWMDSFPLANWTHKPGNIPEWQDPMGSRVPIELVDILRAVGFPSPEAAVERIEQQKSINRSFRGLE